MSPPSGGGPPPSFMPEVQGVVPTREHLALKQQFEVQSANFAAVLTDLQMLTVELDEQRAETAAKIQAATEASCKAAEEAEARAAAMEQHLVEAEQGAVEKEEQRVREVQELGDVLSQLQEQWMAKKQQYAWASNDTHPAHTAVRPPTVLPFLLPPLLSLPAVDPLGLPTRRW